MGQITFGAGYANEKTSGTDMNQKADSYGLQALYAINKQFTAYGGVLSTKVTPDVGSSVTKTKTAVGLTMSF
jgi:predicted porin